MPTPITENVPSNEGVDVAAGAEGIVHSRESRLRHCRVVQPEGPGEGGGADRAPRARHSK